MQRLLFFLGFVALVAGAVYLLVVQQVPRPRPTGRPGLPANVMTMQDVTLRHQRDDRLAWTVWAARAVYSEGARRARLHEVRFELYGADDTAAEPPVQVQVQGEADVARVFQDSERLVLTGAVRLSTPDGTRILGERMVYDHAAGRVRVPGAFRLERGDIVHEGRALVYSLPDGRVTFREPRAYR